MVSRFNAVTRTIIAVAVATCLAAASDAGGASAQTAPAAKVDPIFEAARAHFDGLPESERKAIQEALIWTGDFSGAGTGGYGPLTHRGVLAFQKRQNAPADGILQARDRAALEAAAARAKQAVAFVRVTEPRSGVRVGVPQRLFDKPPAPVPGGMRYTATNGTLLELTSQAGGDADLPALFDRYKADGAGRRVTYKVLRPDWFVVAAEFDGRKTYTRLSAGPGGLRGFTFTYPASAPDLDRMVIAIANSFEAFPAPTPAVAAVQPGLPAAKAPPASPPAAAPVPAGPTLAGTAWAVALGKAVTTAVLAGCSAVTVDRKPARIAANDVATGLTLLDASGLRPAGLAFVSALPGDGAALVAVGFAAVPEIQLTTAPAEARAPQGSDALRVFAPIQKGAAGTALFDRQGRLAGLVLGSAPEPRLVAGVAPAASWPTVGGAAVAKFLSGHGVSVPAGAGAPEPMSVGQIAASAKGAASSVECQRAP
ncbi:hypothetical protein GCM10007036_00730 [Alsobacter metallidurans]|uniref:Peptidoglycan binding-like domain-containing protein n=1 Tax=Alsobacter metallidurans TaxID=340221 RepID=A0A917I3F2_9HYPH|nr:peptidoglycan-binding protein [Alsobacter metallidurans]GGH06377.1 hypothetical protein GCM10007036_00730 [Alsobacter metallidurans]